MKKCVFWLLIATLGCLGACQPDRAAPTPALFKPAHNATAHRPTTRADAERLSRHLTQQLGLTPAQEKQISQLTLVQAHDEQHLWTRLADTARQQLQVIARQYDGELKAVLTPSQYRQFVRLRQSQRRRSRATAETRLRW